MSLAATQLPLVNCAAESQLTFLGVDPEETIELRTVGPVRSFYRRAKDVSATDLPRAVGTYVVANRRRDDRHAPTTDRDITARRVMMVDLDYECIDRTKGESTTLEQRGEVYEVAFAVAAYMGESGFAVDSGAWVESGNGVQLHVRLDDLPCTAAVEGAITRILRGLQSRFGDGLVKIDCSVTNAARLYPLAGTMKRKGTDASLHRPVEIYPPSRPVTPVTLAELLDLADRIGGPSPSKGPGPGPKKAGAYTTANAGDLRTAAADRGKLHGTDDVECPGCGRYQGSMATILESAEVPGTDVVKCQSDTCKPHHRGVYTFVDAVAGWDGVAPAEVVRPAAPSNDNGITILTTADLFAPQSEAAYLVKELGIAPGAPTMLVGQGYVGKTILAMSLGVSVAAGRPIWGRFEPSRRGRVLHLDHEQGRRVTSMRLQRLARGVGVSQAELTDRWGCVVLPRVNLASPNARDVYAHLFEGWDLVILDALKGMTPGVEENSSAMRDYMHVLTEASEATGTVPLVIHHAGKTPLQGSRPRKEMARGSSGIYDECQTVFVLTGEKGTPIGVSHEKDRERGECIEDFSLAIRDVDARAGLVVHPVSTPSPHDLDAERSAALQARVIAYVETHPDGPHGMAEIRASAGGRDTAVRSALRGLLAAGTLTNTGTTSRPRYVVAVAS